MSSVGRIRPRSMPEWMRWVESRLRVLDRATFTLATVPVGGLVAWAGGPGTDGIPPGWLAADGATFSSDDYPNLAAQVGDTFGVHSGTTYHLPNPAPLATGASYIIRAA